MIRLPSEELQTLQTWGWTETAEVVDVREEELVVRGRPLSTRRVERLVRERAPDRESVLITWRAAGLPLSSIVRRSFSSRGREHLDRELVDWGETGGRPILAGEPIEDRGFAAGQWVLSRSVGLDGDGSDREDHVYEWVDSVDGRVVRLNQQYVDGTGDVARCHALGPFVRYVAPELARRRSCLRWVEEGQPEEITVGGRVLACTRSIAKGALKRSLTFDEITTWRSDEVPVTGVARQVVVELDGDRRGQPYVTEAVAWGQTGGAARTWPSPRSPRSHA